MKSGERVGIVGRTGSGKTSLTLSLLRAIYAEGSVFCDGVDTGDGGYLLGDVTDRDARDELAPNGVPFVLAENGRCFCGVDWVANVRGL